MTPQLRGMVLTSIPEGTYVNVTFVVPDSDAVNIDLEKAFEELARMVRTQQIRERPIALRREFIQPV